MKYFVGSLEDLSVVQVSVVGSWWLVGRWKTCRRVGDRLSVVSRSVGASVVDGTIDNLLVVGGMSNVGRSVLCPPFSFRVSILKIFFKINKFGSGFLFQSWFASLLI